MDEFEIKAVMDLAECNRENAVEALEWSNNRVGMAIKMIKGD